MWKINIIMVLGLFCFLYAATVPASQAYWEGVGPTWDKMLNPSKFGLK